MNKLKVIEEEDVENDADQDVLEIPTGTTNVTVAGALTAGGILKTDDATDATSTTDGSLQTDGGLSVAKDAVIGDDLKLLSDSAVIHFGADSDITLTHAADTSLTTNGVMIATTFEPSADTAAGDNAAIGYTSAEGLILTGQGSTNDVTIKNDADQDVLEIPTGTTNVTVVGDVTAGGTLNVTGDTAAGDDAAVGYTAAEGLILTGQGSTNDVTIKNDADADVIEIPTGTQQVVFDGAVKLTQTAITGDANRNIDLQLSNNFFVTMSANIDLTFTNAANAIGSSGIIVIKQDGTGGRSFTLKPAANVKTPANGATIVQATNANEYATISYYVAAEDFILINYIGDYA